MEYFHLWNEFLMTVKGGKKAYQLLHVCNKDTNTDIFHIGLYIFGYFNRQLRICESNFSSADDFFTYNQSIFNRKMTNDKNQIYEINEIQRMRTINNQNDNAENLKGSQMMESIRPFIANKVALENSNR